MNAAPNDGHDKPKQEFQKTPDRTHEDAADDGHGCVPASARPKDEDSAESIIADMALLLSKAEALGEESAAAIERLESDLREPVQSASLTETKKTVLLVFSYLGVAAYVLAVVYLSAYYGRVAPGQITDYPYVETIGLFLRSGAMLLLIALPIAVYMASFVLGVSWRTRERLHRVTTLSSDYTASSTELTRSFAERTARLRQAADDAERPSLTSEERAAATCQITRLRTMVEDLEFLCAKQEEAVRLMLQRLTPPVRWAISFATRALERPKRLIPLGLALTVAPLLIDALMVAAPMPTHLAAVLIQLGALLAATLLGALYWFWMVVVDLLFGPGTRRARIASAVTLAFASMLLVTFIVNLGAVVGATDVRFPGKVFPEVVVSTEAGPALSGFLVPLLGSSDVVVLQPGQGGANGSLTRYPASVVRSVRLSARSSVYGLGAP